MKTIKALANNQKSRCPKRDNSLPKIPTNGIPSESEAVLGPHSSQNNKKKSWSELSKNYAQYFRSTLVWDKRRW